MYCKSVFIWLILIWNIQKKVYLTKHEKENNAGILLITKICSEKLISDVYRAYSY